MNEPLSVLILEDSVSDAKLVVHELERTGQTIAWERAEDAATMRAILEKQHTGLIIADWSMPHFSAPAALDIVKEMGLDIPFIIVSGTVGEELAVEAMRAGAHDYVMKDRLARLAPAVERELREAAARKIGRRTEQNLRVSEARFARLAESGIVGIAIADVLGNIHEANDTYLGMIGYSRDEVMSGTVRWADLTPPEWQAADAVAIAQLEAEGIARPWEKEFIRKDGTRIPVLIGVAMLDYPACIVFLADLTGRKIAEEALRRSEARLVQSQKMEAVGSLAGGIAHDFNNLLSVILSYSEMVTLALDPSDPMRADVEEIHTAGRRAANLTHQLLAFSRQQVLEPKLVNLHEIVSQIEKMLRRLIGEDIELITVGTSALSMVMVDPGQMEQIIMNLVVNARDAMPRGGRLTIETADVLLDDTYAMDHPGVTPGPHVMLSVTDTGSGMDGATQARIFEPFFTTKEKGKGTGLGLSTVFGIVEQSAGTIEVESEPGKGTTFRIMFSRADETVDQSDVAEIPEAGTIGGTETILLVEDEERVRAVVRTILRRSGYHVLEAESGADALLICEHHAAAIHLLLTDVVMPQMNGLELAHRVRLLRPETRILFMSGYNANSIIQREVLSSDIAILQKPLTPQALTARVRRTLSERRAPRIGPRP